MQLKLNESNISEDWGWFVDTETLLLVDQVKRINQVNKKYNNKLQLNNINKLEKITEEDEYDIESLKKTECLVINTESLIETCQKEIIAILLIFGISFLLI